MNITTAVWCNIPAAVDILALEELMGEMRRIDDLFIGRHGPLVDHAEETSLLM